ncbi:ABC transporter ATP-binding protein [Corynebacterium uterequi]|uniref:ABC-type quaternary amine transporter n=1 Tax=Corynebacterium uterequi TaxID=1072256 RepID=A0A0G3HJE1_9CORY|nr:ABC transporter ATP-binding protein [Corynebacterium uterequi]AKK11222.1 ABC-type spermidine/putrescine transport system, ATPase component [Corynebacterium uterequi]
MTTAHTQGLRVDNVAVKYGEKVAVSNISMAVAPGETTAVIGPSGCGKSTTLKAVAGLNHVAEGQITLAGRDITYESPAKRNIGLVPQSYACFPHMTVASNIGYGLRARKVPADQIEAKVKSVLELTQLTAFAERKPGQLSGGQRQRVALGRALAIEPDILLLDEPLAALDPQLRGDLRRELATMLAQAGCGTLIVTHDQHEALSLATHIAILRDGAMVQYGTPDDLWNRPINTFVADFLANATLLDAVVEGDTVSILGGTWTAPVSTFERINDDRDPQLLVRATSLELVPMGTAHAIEGTVKSVEYAGGRFLAVVRTPHEDFQVNSEDPIEEGDVVSLGFRLGKAALIGRG